MVDNDSVLCAVGTELLYVFVSWTKIGSYILGRGSCSYLLDEAYRGSFVPNQLITDLLPHNFKKYLNIYLSFASFRPNVKRSYNYD